MNEKRLKAKMKAMGFNMKAMGFNMKTTEEIKAELQKKIVVAMKISKCDSRMHILKTCLAPKGWEEKLERLEVRLK